MRAATAPGRPEPRHLIGSRLPVTWDTAAVPAEDPDLAAGLGGPRLAAARRECLARTLSVHRGPFAHDGDPGDLGLLLLDGLVVQRLGRRGRYGCELLGPDDLLRPWEHGDERGLLRCTASYSVLREARLAVLDRRFATRLAPYPEVAGALVGRAMHRARTLAVQLAIAHHPRVDDRLLLLFWGLAERWGRVTPQGVHLTLGVTHECLADLVAARRPSISAGLARLSRDGRVTPARRGWLLHGAPPSALTARRGPEERTRTSQRPTPRPFDGPPGRRPGRPDG